jgi:hypothetical protein
VTKHLKVLERAGLVRAHRAGRERRYVCAPEAMREANEYLDEVSRHWDLALQRLADFLQGYRWTTPTTRGAQRVSGRGRLGAAPSIDRNQLLESGDYIVGIAHTGGTDPESPAFS